MKINYGCKKVVIFSMVLISALLLVTPILGGHSVTFFNLTHNESAIDVGDSEWLANGTILQVNISLQVAPNATSNTTHINISSPYSLWDNGFSIVSTAPVSFICDNITDKYINCSGHDWNHSYTNVTSIAFNITTIGVTSSAAQTWTIYTVESPEAAGGVGAGNETVNTTTFTTYTDTDYPTITHSSFTWPADFTQYVSKFNNSIFWNFTISDDSLNNSNVIVSIVNSSHLSQQFANSTGGADGTGAMVVISNSTQGSAQMFMADWNCTNNTYNGQLDEDTTYYFVVNVTDNVGRSADLVQTTAIRLDRTAPTFKVIDNSRWANGNAAYNATDVIFLRVNLTDKNLNISGSNLYGTVAYILIQDTQTELLNSSSNTSLTILVDQNHTAPNVANLSWATVNVTWTIPAGTKDGNYTFRLNITDKAGNTVGVDNDTVFMVATGPSFRAESVDDDLIKSGQPVVFSINVTDFYFNVSDTYINIINASGIVFAKCNVTADTNATLNMTRPWISYDETQLDISWSGLNGTGSNVPDGVYFLNVTTTNNQSQSAYSRTIFTGVNVTVDNTAPVVAFHSAVWPGGVTNWTAYERHTYFNFTVTDLACNASTVEVYIVNSSNTAQVYATGNHATEGDSISLTNSTVERNGGTACTITFQALWNGTDSSADQLPVADTYYFRVNTTDSVNISSATLLTDRLINYDNTTPSVDTMNFYDISDDTNLQGAKVWANKGILNISFTEANANTITYRVINTSSLTMAVIQPTTMAVIGDNTSTSDTIDTLFIPYGNWTLEVNLTDKGGNSNISNVTVDSQAAIRKTLTTGGTATATSGSNSVVQLGIFNVTSKYYPYVRLYMELKLGGTGTAYDNSNNHSFITNDTSSVTIYKYQAGGNTSYLNPTAESLTMRAATSSNVPSLYNATVAGTNVYFEEVRLFATAYSGLSAGSYAGTYGFGLFTS